MRAAGGRSSSSIEARVAPPGSATLHPLTLTHARIRAAQGELRGARSILEAILRDRPDHAEARALLQALAGRAAVERAEERDPVAPPPVAADSAQLAHAFRRALGRGAASPRHERMRRLAAWRDRVARSRSTS